MDRSNIRTVARGTILVVTLVIAMAGPALAHKVSVFAAVVEGTIEGEAYTSGGDPLKNCPIKLLDPDGRLLGETRTGDDGKFRFKPTTPVDHLIVLDTGDGHRAEFKVGAEELDGITSTANRVEPEPVSLPDDIDQRIADAVAKETVPLRRRIDQYERKTRFRDILGGIGYIFGVAGIVLYYKSAEQSKK